MAYTLTDEQVKAAKLQHPRAVKVSALGGSIDVVVRPPTRGEWRMFRQYALSSDANKQSSADETLFFACCIAPSKEEQRALVEEFPAFPTTVGATIGRLAGHDAKAEADF